jgi:hypothetical protein
VAETEAPTDAELGALRRLVAGAGRAA